MKGIFLLLGTNQGDKLANLQRAKDILEAYEMSVIDYSSIYESAPWGVEDQDWFLNMVLRINTIHGPENLLKICFKVETQMGRTRFKRWGERIIDIDILYYDNYSIESPELAIPHPAIQVRRFTLMPMSEIAPNEKHPLLNLSQAELLDICPDNLECKKTSLTIGI